MDFSRAASAEAVVADLMIAGAGVSVSAKASESGCDGWRLVIPSA